MSSFAGLSSYGNGFGFGCGCVGLGTGTSTLCSTTCMNGSLAAALFGPSACPVTEAGSFSAFVGSDVGGTKELVSCSFTSPLAAVLHIVFMSSVLNKILRSSFVILSESVLL